MATIPLTSLSAAGLISTPAALGIAASAGGDVLPNPDQDTLLVVFNGAGVSQSVTIADPGASPAGNPGTPAAVAVAAGALAFIPVGPAHASPSTGQASITYSAVASMRVVAVRR